MCSISKLKTFDVLGNNILLYHGSGEVVEFPAIRKARYTKDFSWGFYCTNSIEQATRWAIRKNKTPILNKYFYKPNPLLKVLKFDKTSNDWLDFIVKCRKGEHHFYDIVEGPMADDTIWDYIQDFISGDISREAFFELIKFKYPTHQISFHTIAALDCLFFQGGELLNENEN